MCAGFGLSFSRALARHARLRALLAHRLVTRLVPIVVKAVFRFVPMVRTAPMTTTAIKAAMSPYSIAVAPFSSRMNA